MDPEEAGRRHAGLRARRRELANIGPPESSSSPRSHEALPAPRDRNSSMPGPYAPIAHMSIPRFARPTLLLTAALLASCQTTGERAPAPPNPAASEAGAWLVLEPPNDGGSLVGRVVWRGAPPTPIPARIEHSRRVAPDAEPGDPAFVLGPPVAGSPEERGLADVAVVFDGPHAFAGPGPAEHTIRLEHFDFEPRVSLARPGDRLLFVNESPLLHNARIVAGGETLTNRALGPGRSFELRVPDPGRIGARCDVHPWSIGWIISLAPRERALVTGRDGRFQVLGPGGPDGASELELRLWHERLGETVVRVAPPFTEGREIRLGP